MTPVATAGSLELAQALSGLPVAVVLAGLAIFAWRLVARGEMVTSREHHEALSQMEIRISVADSARETALEEVRYWQSVALRALNVSEAALGRRDLRE